MHCGILLNTPQFPNRGQTLTLGTVKLTGSNIVLVSRYARANSIFLISHDIFGKNCTD